MKWKWGLMYIFGKKLLLITISSVLLSSCYEEKGLVEIDDLEMRECFDLEDNFNNLKIEFFLKVNGSDEIVFVSKEINKFYSKTVGLRQKASSCVSELYDKYEDRNLEPEIKKIMIGLLSRLGKREAIIHTHMNRMNIDNVKDELWMLKKMLD